MSEFSIPFQTEEYMKTFYVEYSCAYLPIIGTYVSIIWKLKRPMTDNEHERLLKVFFDELDKRGANALVVKIYPRKQ